LVSHADEFFWERDRAAKDKVMSALRTELQAIGRTRPNTDAHLTPEKKGIFADRIVLNEDAFVSMLYLERRRAERAQKCFVLMLVDLKNTVAESQKTPTVTKVTGALLSVTRETDIVGWYLEDHLIGVICTEVGKAEPRTVRDRMLEKVKKAFVEALPPEKVSKMTVSFHFFPEEGEESGTDHSANITLYPDLSRQEE
jgi:hypothetical protein